MCSVHRPAHEGPTIYACAQSGCQACVARLLRQHAGLVHWVIRHDCGSDLPYGELLHEGQIALWQAIRHYDTRRGLCDLRGADDPPSAMAAGGPGAAPPGCWGVAGAPAADTATPSPDIRPPAATAADTPPPHTASATYCFIPDWD